MNGSANWLASAATALLLTAGLSLDSTPRAAAAQALPDAEVEGLQMPAWLTRDGKKMPLTLGERLKNGDSISTGTGSRVLLRLAEGSVVKLGENARFTVNDMARDRDGERERFKATLGVARGAFRFTTSPESKKKTTRNIDVSFPSVTAEVRGTDLWGKAADDKQVVALVEGEINVRPKGGAPIQLKEERTVYIMPADAPPPPTFKITLAQLNGFAQETEMQPGSGVVGRGGNWKVYAARTPDKDEAIATYNRLTDAGYAAAIQPAFYQGKQIYQVRIMGFLSESDGVAVAVKLRVELGLQDVHVSL